MDKEEALKLVEENGFELENLSGELKKDREVVLVAVQQNGNAIHFADEQYKKDKEVVLIAINSNWSSYQFADDKLQNDKDVLNILESNEDYIKEKNIKKIHLNLEKFFDLLIENHEDYFREENTFKVRPGVAYDKFYINQIEGSYDMSLQGLIHHYLWENELYHLFLSDEELETCEQVVNEQPEYIFGPDSGETQEIIDEIQAKAIVFVGKKLIKLGFDVEQDFESYLS